MKLSLVLYDAWKHCKNVHQLVHSLTSASQLSNSDLLILFNKLQELFSSDAKSNAIVLLVARRYGLDVNSLASKIQLESLTRGDEHVLYRALSECGCGVDVASALFESHRDASTALAALNFASGYCNFARDGHIVPDADTIKNLLAKVQEHLHLLNGEQVLDLASLLLVLVEHSGDVQPMLQQVVQQLRDANIDDLPKLIDFTLQVMKLVDVDTQPLVGLLQKCLQLNRDIILDPEQTTQLAYILGKHYHIRPAPKVLDSIAIQVRKCYPQLTLEQISQLVVSLSKFNYSNRPLLRCLAREATLRLRENALVDATVVTNLYTGFSRLEYKTLALYKLLGDVLQNDHVFNELQIHDLVTIVRAHARIHWVNDRLFKRMESMLFNPRLVNASVATRVLIAHGKLCHENKPLHNHLIEAIDLESVKQIPIEAENLRWALNRLGIFCPELGPEVNVELPKIAYKSTAAPMRPLKHVRKLKWTW